MIEQLGAGPDRRRMPWYSAADARSDAERIGRKDSWATAGEILTPKPEWNKSEGQRRNHLPDSVEVLDVIPARSQSGVLYRVKTIGGDFRDLDAGWFEAPNHSSIGGTSAESGS